jgi:hypothetical protein
MSSVVISGDTSGQVTLAAPAVAGTNTLTLQAATATSAVNTLGTAVASTSGTSIDFTSIPSWVKRITVMFSGVSLSGSSSFLVQIGSGSITNTGYVSSSSGAASTVGTLNSTAGHILYAGNATLALNGIMTLALISNNTWANSHAFGSSSGIVSTYFGGGISPALSGALDRVRITTVNGTDTFDAGTINILYEG